MSNIDKIRQEIDLEEVPAEIYVTMPKKETGDYVGAAWRTNEESCEHIKYIRADLVYGGLDPELFARGHYYQPPGL